VYRNEPSAEDVDEVMQPISIRYAIDGGVDACDVKEYVREVADPVTRQLKAHISRNYGTYAEVTRGIIRPVLSVSTRRI